MSAQLTNLIDSKVDDDLSINDIDLVTSDLSAIINDSLFSELLCGLEDVKNAAGAEEGDSGWGDEEVSPTTASAVLTSNLNGELNFFSAATAAAPMVTITNNPIPAEVTLDGRRTGATVEHSYVKPCEDDMKLIGVGVEVEQQSADDDSTAFVPIQPDRSSAYPPNEILVKRPVARRPNLKYDANTSECSLVKPPKYCIDESTLTNHPVLKKLATRRDNETNASKRNGLAAKYNREKRKLYIHFLERNVDRLSRENERLEYRLKHDSSAAQEVTELRNENAYLKQFVFGNDEENNQLAKRKKFFERGTNSDC